MTYSKRSEGSALNFGGMRHLFSAALIISCAAPLTGQSPSAADWAKARRVLAATPLIDSHNDLPWVIRENADAPMDVERYDLRKTTKGMTDFARLRAGMLG